jgi:hypothetical protein
MANTLQSNIKQGSDKITQYSLFLGGLNTKSSAIEQYTPLRTGYARIFFVKMPVFMKQILPTKTANFKHMLEYGFVGIDGIQNTTLEFEQVTGGYAGRSFDVASVAKDETNEITIKLYEFSGSPVREYTDMWISGISDPNTGIGHYHGAISAATGIVYNQANHTAEAIYVQTDPTGREEAIEYACLLTNMMPKNVKKDHFNYESGQHPVVQVDVPFTCVKYESPQINTIAKQLITKYKILRNYLEFNSGYTEQNVLDMPDATITDWPTS